MEYSIWAAGGIGGQRTNNPRGTMTRKQRRILQIEHAMRQADWTRLSYELRVLLIYELVALKNGATVAGARKARDG